MSAPKDRFYLLCDQSVQWFTYVVRVNWDNKVVKYYEIPSAMNGPFLSNIFAREPNFMAKEFCVTNGRDIYAGWAVSERDYNRLVKLVELHQSHTEYLKLLALDS